MGHAAILHRMRDMGRASKIKLVSDPMNGYLANLDPDDYKALFRPHVPEQIGGERLPGQVRTHRRYGNAG